MTLLLTTYYTYIILIVFSIILAQNRSRRFSKQVSFTRKDIEGKIRLELTPSASLKSINTLVKKGLILKRKPSKEWLFELNKNIIQKQK